MLQVNQREVLRYLGYHGKPADEQVLQTISSCERELNEKCTPRGIYRIFPMTFFEGGILVGSMRIVSAGLAKHLHGCEKAALFAATLGVQADLLLEQTAKTDMSRAAVLQATAAAMTESFCNEKQKEVAAEAAAQGYWLRPRFSPGYGDFSIGHQREILKILDCPKRIGLSVTESLMLVPTKSVTAVIGMTKEKQGCHVAGCAQCEAENCAFREEV